MRNVSNVFTHTCCVLLKRVRARVFSHDEPRRLRADAVIVWYARVDDGARAVHTRSTVYTRQAHSQRIAARGAKEDKKKTRRTVRDDP